MSYQEISFTVVGTPRTAGSKSIGRTRTGGAFIRGAGKYEKQWRSQVTDAARESHANRPLIYGPVALHLAFYFARPKSHLSLRKGEPVGVRPSAPTRHTQKPDCTKMTRALEDALTGVIWQDDSQVIVQTVSKHWANVGDPSRAEVRVCTLTTESAEVA